MAEETDPLAGATVIAPDDDFSGAPLLRTEFDLAADHGDLVSATLTATALGIVDLEIGGRPVAPDVLTPGWSSYEWRIRYRSYDVTGLLPAPGDRAAIGASLGNGWYRGRIGFTGGVGLYGDELGQYAGRVKRGPELTEMAAEYGEFRVYVVEVCQSCGWNHLATSYVLGTGEPPAGRGRRARSGQ